MTGGDHTYLDGVGESEYGDVAAYERGGVVNELL